MVEAITKNIIIASHLVGVALQHRCRVRIDDDPAMFFDVLATIRLPAKDAVMFPASVRLQCDSIAVSIFCEFFFTKATYYASEG